MKILDSVRSNKTWIIIGALVLIAILVFSFWMNGQDGRGGVQEAAVDVAMTPTSTPAPSPTASQAPTPTPTLIMNSGPTVWVAGNSVNRYQEDSQERRAAIVVNSVGEALAAEDSQALYELLSEEIKEVFSEDSVKIAMAETTGLRLEPLGDIRVNGDFAEQEVVGRDENGSSEKFMVVLKKENNEWKLYGTMRIE